MTMSRRAFLISTAVAAVGVAGVTDLLVHTEGGPAKPKLLWSEEFEHLDLASPANPRGRWRPNDVWQPIDRGYADFATGQHSTWLVNPAETLSGTSFNPFSVADSVLSISCTRTPPAALAQVNGCPWLGGLLVSNTDLPEMVFGYGYYEFRARFPTTGKGMFPALWFFAARDRNTQAQSAAEIDLFEIFGAARGTPWFSTLHRTGAQSDQTNVQTQTLDTRGWHTYGIDWAADRMDFYYDRHRIARANLDAVRGFTGSKMAIRVDFVMDALFFEAGNKSDASTPSRLHLDLDYIRQYDRFA